MKDKEQVINEILQKSLDYLNNTEKFLSDEVPLYVNELMNFKVIEHLIQGFSSSIFFTLFLGSLFMALVPVMYAEFKKIWLCIVYVCSVFTVLFIVCIAANGDDFIQAYKAYSAPRVYLIDYLRNEIK